MVFKYAHMQSGVADVCVKQAKMNAPNWQNNLTQMFLDCCRNKLISVQGRR